MSNRLPWFKCNPTLLLGALAGMDEHEGYVYVTVLMRIYETGGPIKDTAKTIARRIGKTEKAVSAALVSLTETGKITIIDGTIDSDSTHETLDEMNEVKKVRQKAGKVSAEKREQKAQQFQQNEPTHVEHVNNTPSTNRDIDRELERKKESPAPAPLDLLTSAETPEPPRPPRETQGFTEFYEAYPKHVDRKAAAAKFAATIKAGITPDRLLEGARRYAAACREKRTEPKFIKSPEVWLNKGCWDDDLGATIPASSAPVLEKTDDAWRKMLEYFCSNRGHWPWDQTSPEPGRAGCKVPQHILDEFAPRVREVTRAIA